MDEAAAVELARRVLAAEGVEDGELGLAFAGPDEMRALKRDHLGIDEATDVLSFPIDGREELAEGMPRALGDVVLCPQVVGEEWRTPLVHGLLHLLGYEHGDEMEEREAAHAVRPRKTPSILESFNFAFEGIIHVLRTQRNLRIHFVVAALVLVAALLSDVDKLELIALLLAIAFVLIAEMLNTAVEAAIDVATTSFDPMAKLAKDIAAGAVLIATAVAVAVGYLVFSGQVATRELEAARPADRRVGRADPRRALPDDDRRDRHESAHRPRVAAPRRPSVRPRRRRLRGLDGGDAASSATRSITS